MLNENITETQWAAWKARFDCCCMACKLSDKTIENRVFETVPSSLAEQIAVNLTGDETKYVHLTNIKAAVVKKRSVLIYRKNFHQLSQCQGEDPKRFAAQIKQAAPACRFTADRGTPMYGGNLMSPIFLLGLLKT